jgi:hypothetical protein
VVRDDAEALRRRLYAPGAAGDDVDRYRAARGGAEAQQEAPDRTAPRPRSRAGTGVAVAIAVALALGGIGVARVAARPQSTSPAPTPLAVEAADRGSFEQNLALGNAAGIAAYLLTTRPLPIFRGATRFDTLEDTGVGDGTVVLSPVVAEAVAGTATVLVVTDQPALIGWTTLRRKIDVSGEQEYVRQVRRESMQTAGVLTGHRFRYAPGNRPVELRIEAPEGVRWGAAVVFSD